LFIEHFIKSYSLNNTKDASQFFILELNGRPSNVITFSIDFSFQNLIFCDLFEFSMTKITYMQHFPHPKSKNFKIYSIKSCSSRSFQHHQRHIVWQLWFNLIFNEKSFNIQKNLHANPNVMKPNRCTPLPRELFKDAKNMIWRALVWWIS